LSVKKQSNIDLFDRKPVKAAVNKTNPAIHFFRAKNYDLAATLGSGQAFRWHPTADGAWEGVIGCEYVLLREAPNQIEAHSWAAQPDWSAIQHYLQTNIDIDAITATFPDDPPMRAAIEACGGLRLLRQNPWECLASFILSSTKQIVQIQQIVAAVCCCYGDEIQIPDPRSPIRNSFPSAARLAGLTEAQLRSCKMGFRAPYLLETARIVATGQIELESLRIQPTPKAREMLCELPGVGEKIANCVLLFAYGFQDAFPVDVWVQKAIRQLYFPKRKPSPKRLRRFVETHFGPNAGYAQQYLFHYMRTQRGGQEDQNSEASEIGRRGAVRIA
jgi:N-glycosylase/DNA lyase